MRMCAREGDPRSVSNTSATNARWATVPNLRWDRHACFEDVRYGGAADAGTPPTHPFPLAQVSIRVPASILARIAETQGEDSPAAALAAGAGSGVDGGGMVMLEVGPVVVSGRDTVAAVQSRIGEFMVTPSDTNPHASVWSPVLASIAKRDGALTLHCDGAPMQPTAAFLAALDGSASGDVRHAPARIDLRPLSGAALALAASGSVSAAWDWEAMAADWEAQ